MKKLLVGSFAGNANRCFVRAFGMYYRDGRELGSPVVLALYAIGDHVSAYFAVR